MNRIELEHKLLYELRYLSIETLEKMLDFILFLRNDTHTQQIVKQQPLGFSEKHSIIHRQVNKKISLKEMLLQGPILTTEECQRFEENRKWMELWEERF
jgi:hypothetical protein